ncbi:MAG TPA: glucose-6-phosphate dehydrogenase [Steroidobacteraceae bacterium]|nr:glucose-6-phosphate dehydrogenase [Steroidobacteraceae bacterium]
MTRIPPSVLTIFGVTGDLSQRLLFPSLYNLVSTGTLPEGFRVVGVGRRDWTDRTLRNFLDDALKQFLGGKPESRVTRWLAQRTFYHKATFDDQAGFASLAEKIRHLGARSKAAAHRLYYLAVPPEFIEQIVHKLEQTGQASENTAGWTRVIVEKPFGHDAASATALNRQLLKSLREDQIYRIDHFAGKDAVQDLAVFRFSNALFEPLWHRSLIDSVQITAAETVGVEGRAEFYEHSGALRDMVPNHLMELLANIAMEPPVSFSVEHMREKQLELLDSVRPIRPREVSRHAVRGQYVAGRIGRKSIPGYRREEGVNPRSQVETYVALQLEIDNWRWSGVPFFLRTGKSLARSVTEIAVQFRPAPARLFPEVAADTAPVNQIVFEMKPKQGIHLTFGGRAPGLDNQVIPGDMAYEFPPGPFAGNAKGYERPLRDAMLGNPLLFPSAGFIERGWRLIQPLLDAWAPARGRDIPQYPAGSQGPAQADALLARTGHGWRPLK